MGAFYEIDGLYVSTALVSYQKDSETISGIEVSGTCLLKTRHLTLWRNNMQVEQWKNYANNLQLVSDRQRHLISSLQDTIKDLMDDNIFYNVRSSHYRDLEPLDGPLLTKDVQKRIVNYTSREAKIVAVIDTIEKGEVRGWACMLKSNSSQSPMEISLYVDERLVGTVYASEYTSLPSDALNLCLSEANLTRLSDTQIPVGFSVSLPPLPIGLHEARVLACSSNSRNTFVEALHSPAIFVESTNNPNLDEIINRKDAIILQRNAELAALWNHVKYELPWRSAEADGYEKNGELKPSVSKPFSYVVIIKSTYGARELRNIIRSAWMKHTERLSSNSPKLAIKFIIASTSKLERISLNNELRSHNDVIIVEDPDAVKSQARLVTAGLEIFFASGLTADVFVVSHDKIAMNFDAIVTYFKDFKFHSNGYFGCMRSGLVIGQKSSKWYEPEEWRFGDRINGALAYPQHAAGEFYAIGIDIAKYIARNRYVLHYYAFEDTTFGAWLLSLDVRHVNDQRFCCSSDIHCTTSYGMPCLAVYDPKCNGMCDPKTTLATMFQACAWSHSQ